MLLKDFHIKSDIGSNTNRINVTRLCVRNATKPALCEDYNFDFPCDQKVTPDQEWILNSTVQGSSFQTCWDLTKKLKAMTKLN